MKGSVSYFLILLIIVFSIWSDLNSKTRSEPHSPTAEYIDLTAKEDVTKFENSVKDDFKYYGLSSYLGNSLFVGVDEKGRVSHYINASDAYENTELKWIGYRGRFEAILIKAEGETKAPANQALERGRASSTLLIKGTTQKASANVSDYPDLNKTKYAHLPSFIRFLCRAVEWLYRLLVSLPGVGWAMGLVLLAISLKLIMAPISLLTMRWQLEANLHREALDPLHQEIKKNMKGEAAHKALMKSYKDRGITPYYSLKPFLATAIGLPILIAVFNMLGEIYDIRNTSFLWAESLAYPDSFAQLGFKLPFFGDRLNVFPALMTLATIYAAFANRNDKVGRAEYLRQRRGLIWMAVAFFFLFYNFPSGMIIYWTLATLLSVIFAKLFNTIIAR